MTNGSNKTEDNKQRRAMLEDTWLLMAKAVLRTLQSEEPSASALEVARKWLDSNSVTLDTLRGWAGGLGDVDPASLPTFDDSDDDDSEGSNAPAALRTVVPFAK